MDGPATHADRAQQFELIEVSVHVVQRGEPVGGTKLQPFEHHLGIGGALVRCQVGAGFLAGKPEVLAPAGTAQLHDRIEGGAPITHGNAISVYFKDPEGNGIEVFCDTPWHVEQPQVAGWDPTRSDDEVLSDVEAAYRDKPGFGPMDEYRARRARDFGEA